MIWNSIPFNFNLEIWNWFNWIWAWFNLSSLWLKFSLILIKFQFNLIAIEYQNLNSVEFKSQIYITFLKINPGFILQWHLNIFIFIFNSHVFSKKNTLDFLLYEIIMFKLIFYLDLIWWNSGSIWKKSLNLIQ